MFAIYIYILFQEKKRNSLKDFLNVAGPMGVTHFLILSKTATAPYLRVGRTPQGPTLTFKINEYSLAVDVAQSQLRPRCPQDLFQNPPLVILYSHLSKKKKKSLKFTSRQIVMAIWFTKMLEKGNENVKMDLFLMQFSPLFCHQ